MIARGARCTATRPPSSRASGRCSFRELHAPGRRAGRRPGRRSASPGATASASSRRTTPPISSCTARARARASSPTPSTGGSPPTEVERVLERAGPTMFVADASTLPVVGAWPAAKRAVRPLVPARRRARAPASRRCEALYRGGRAAAGCRRRRPTTPFAVISTAAVDVIPRGAALTHANVLTANLTAMAASATRRPTATCWRCRCSTSPRSAPRSPTCTRAARVVVVRATTPRRRCG